MGTKFIFLLVLTFSTIVASTLTSVAEGPIIDVWYGEMQKFGHLGNPQNWINILGNVSDPDGVREISYTLNGSDQTLLSIGPDGRRLQNKGDFNVDLLVFDLNEGSNEVVITATDSLDNTNKTAVNVNYTHGEYWKGDYEFMWDTVTNIQNVAQVVDGKWELTGSGIRTTETGYDRLLAIGDTSWTNYQVEIPITIHDIEPPISKHGGKDFGLGIILRWTGHTDFPKVAAGWQPKSGYLPLGEIGWFNWPRSDTLNTELNFFNTTRQTRNPFKVENGETYIFKMQVVTMPSLCHTYKIKVWKEGTTEPSEWFQENMRGLSKLSYGSILLVAHHVDATFGNPTIQELADGPDIADFFSQYLGSFYALRVRLMIFIQRLLIEIFDLF